MVMRKRERRERLVVLQVDPHVRSDVGEGIVRERSRATRDRGIERLLFMNDISDVC